MHFVQNIKYGYPIYYIWEQNIWYAVFKIQFDTNNFIRTREFHRTFPLFHAYYQFIFTGGPLNFFRWNFYPGAMHFKFIFSFLVYFYINSIWNIMFLYARLKNGRIMLWQCPSVCPSVRPSVRVFRTFFQRALRYQFETWYMHSVGGTTCRVWVSSQLGHFDLVYSQK